MTGPYGIYTNYLETNQAGELASGHEVLSESASLSMRIAARTGQRERFEAAWRTARDTFEQEWGFSYRYSPKQNKAYAMGASVDDLRMIRALYEAGEAFQEPAYSREADKLGERFAQYNVSAGSLRDFYDSVSHKTNTFLTLCYADLRTLQQLPASAKPQSLLENTLSTVEKGYLSDDFPFYETRYDYKDKRYESESIRTVESLLTILHLTEVGREREASIRFIKEQTLKGALYGEYTRDGKPMNQVESTAIYAIAAMIGAERGDAQLYEASLRRLEAFRVTDTASPLFGGFGNATTKEAYSFDNLMALLAYTY